jgi:hypothetical protein
MRAAFWDNDNLARGRAVGKVVFSLGFALGLAIVLGTVAAGPAAAAGPFERFVGGWRGEGYVVGAKGDRERFICSAQYSVAEAGEALSQTIHCAGGGYRIESTCDAKASGGSVQGSWREATRNIGGRLTGRLANGDFEGTVEGPGFTAQFSVVVTDPLPPSGWRYRRHAG